MSLSNPLLLPVLVLACLLAACGGGASNSALPTLGGGGGGGGGVTPTVVNIPAPSSISASDSNVVPVVVDNGGPNITPPGQATSNSLNLIYVTVTICVPATNTCANVDHVQVDTGSSGLRLMYSQLPTSLVNSLPQRSYNGAPLAECVHFADGNSWGSLRTADFSVGSKSVGGMPLQIIGDPAIAEASACEGSGIVQENQPASFGANGVLGINNMAQDCGSPCAQAGQNVYFDCPGNAGCVDTVLPVADQVPNPVTLFASDNNGTMLALPAIPDSGASTVNGYLVFGINTESNNTLGNATIVQTDDSGDVYTSYDGITYGSNFHSYFDSGTNQLGIPNNGSIAVCGSNASGYYYCPNSPVTQSASVSPPPGVSGTPVTADFNIGNAVAYLYANPTISALDNVGTPESATTSGFFIWGEPFFYGRFVYTGIVGQTVSGQTTPFVAF